MYPIAAWSLPEIIAHLVGLNTDMILPRSRVYKFFPQMSRSFVFLLVSLIVIGSRLPFLLPGYGTDPDAWAIPLVARQIAAGGGYAASRFPGHPVQELVSSLIWSGGPFALNGATALLSGFAAAFLALSMMTLGLNRPILGALAFAFVPAVIVSSATSMDYMWAMAFMLGSLYFLLVNKLLTSAILLGIAVGCRISSIAMLLPMGILVLSRGRSYADLIRWLAIAFIVGGIAYLPGFLKYGSELFQLKELGRISLRRVIPIATTGVWGILGLGALTAGFGYSAARLVRHGRSLMSKNNESRIVIWLLPVVLYSIAFLRLPHESGYLIPVIPFAILIISEIAERRVFEIVCVGFLFSSFLLGVHLERPIYFPAPENKLLNYSFQLDLLRWRVYVAPFSGPILSDHSLRASEMDRIQRIISRVNGLNARSVVVTGWNLPKFAVLAPAPFGPAEYVWLLDENQAENYRTNGIQILFLPEMLQTNEEVFGIDLRDFEAQPVEAGTGL